MVTVRDILAVKGNAVFCIAEDVSVLQAAEMMNQRQVGCLVVLAGEQVAGIFTERDVLRRVVAERLDPAHTPLAKVLTRQVICCSPDTTVDEARSVFKNRHIRHLPVVDDEGRLIGLVSIGDLNAYDANAQEVTIHYLHEYLYGRT